MTNTSNQWKQSRKTNLLIYSVEDILTNNHHLRELVRALYYHDGQYRKETEILRQHLTELGHYFPLSGGANEKVFSA